MEHIIHTLSPHVDSFSRLSLYVAIYFLPTLVAYGQRHHNRRAVSVLNTFAGWTFVGWIVALVWAVTRPSVRGEA